MNKKIERMMKEIERRGGVVGINPMLPDELAEEFLQQILDCPDCCAGVGSASTAQGGGGRQNDH